MEISFVTNAGNLTLNNGYGKAGFGLVTSLQRLGNKVPFASETAPVEIAFCQPDYSDWSNDSAYHIQYTPWESTKLHDGWKEAFNDTCDEVWTTSPWCAQVYKDAGVERPIYVYQHGINKIVTPKRRTHGGKIRFLHVGEPAMRKGGQLALNAFRDVFGDRDDVHLTIKAHRRSSVRVYDKSGSILGLPDQLYKNVTIMYDDLTEKALNELYLEHDVLIYPSWGEGFGFIPIEAAATGMPVICTDSWPPYENLLVPDLLVKSRLEDSPWPDTHPGKMYTPDYVSLTGALQRINTRFDWYAGLAIRNVPSIFKAYDWDRLTEDAFAHIVEKFS